jgi:DEAD/DEAH box helicase domain-containing protein
MDPKDLLPGPAADKRSLDAQQGSFVDLEHIDERLHPVLEQEGIEQLYRHQADALDHIEDDTNVVVATQTASGKSLIYLIEALQRARNGGRTLYLSPLNALVNDQAETFTTYATRSGRDPSDVQRYTGQMSSYEKRKARDTEPHILLSNVDMLHMSLLPYAQQPTWDWFFSSLDLIVVDELHYYRGVLGSQVAMVFRRLRRILDEYGVDPAVIATSATIGNPVEHAAAVTGFTDWKSITRDHSSSGRTHWTVLDNDQSPHPKAKRISQNLISRGYQTITFGRARQLSERYILHLKQDLRRDGEEKKAEKVEAYHAALDNDHRTEIETRIKDGDLLGVWSTNALELGVDIGTLDAVVLDGYPGSRMNLHQQAGRAGRGEDDSFVFLVPGEDQLDQYMKHHPDELFGDVEDAKVNPGNVELLTDHLLMAAREKPLTEADRDYFDSFDAAIEAAEADRLLRQQGDRWVPDQRQDGPPFQIRNVVDRSITLIDTGPNEVLTDLNYEAAISDAYPGAVYLHGGTQYIVDDFDKEDDAAFLRPVSRDLEYFTDAEKDKSVHINEELRRETFGDIDVLLADVTVDGSVVGYYKKRRSDQQTLEHTSYDQNEFLPFSFQTKAIVLTLKDTPDEIDELKDGLHAAEHSMIGVLPLHILCDRRNDLGRLSTPLHVDTGHPTIFIHEGHPGGVGLVDDAHEILDQIVDEARDSIEECDCDDGCGSCIYSPTCGNANNHLDKDDGIQVLGFIQDALR